jgi:hypothetical protein
MEVREIAGACGVMTHVVPTVWKSDATTICILLDNPKNGRWLVITLDVREESRMISAVHETEAA